MGSDQTGREPGLVLKQPVMGADSERRLSPPRLGDIIRHVGGVSVRRGRVRTKSLGVQRK